MKTFEIVYAANVDHFVKEHGAMLIDIREREEYDRGHWPRAVSKPYREFETEAVNLPKNRMLLFYCEHGGGSMQLASRLGREGYQTATVVGGYEAMKKIQKNLFPK